MAADKLPDFERMTIDELIEYNVGIKRQMMALRAHKAAVHAVYMHKLEEWHRMQALERAGLTRGPDVTPGPVNLGARGN